MYILKTLNKIIVSLKIFEIMMSKKEHGYFRIVVCPECGRIAFLIRPGYIECSFCGFILY